MAGAVVASLPIVVYVWFDRRAGES